MKKKKLVRSYKKLKKELRRLHEIESSAWMSSLAATIASAVTAALAAERGRESVAITPSAEEERGRVLEEQELDEQRPREGKMPNGMVMVETTGPV